MASTYSDLKIELIGTGDQSGTWGDTSNVNLGTAIEEAIAGRATADFTSDADLTISLTNTNATQVARHLILNVTSAFGSLTTTRNLIVPSIDKPYLIENNTTGAQSIVVKTSAGTGITVPNGKKMFVYANSTNVVDAISYFTALTLGTALPVASGGTGVTTPGTSGNVLTSNGTIWTSAAGSGPGDHEVVVHTGAANGTTNTAINRFATTLSNVGTAITYADSAANGASFTINAAGLYAIYYQFRLADTASPNVVGVSLNSTQLTTFVNSITEADIIGYFFPSIGFTYSMSRVVSLAAADVIRPHSSVAVYPITTISATRFAIRKIGVI